MSEYLLDKLNQYGASDFYPLHMPGHKRRLSYFGDPFSIDITEIDGFDDLHHAQGVLAEAQRRAARLYGAEETYYLVNGSTCGILVAVAASTARSGRILMARNSHRSCYHAAFLNDLRVTYIYPPIAEISASSERGVWSEKISAASERDASSKGTSATSERDTSSKRTTVESAYDTSGESVRGTGICGSISPADVREALSRYSDIQAVLVTSPTYDGVASDIGAIAEAAHKAGAILVVDEAHGAHFGMHPYFPKRALACGADIVINSLHKTLPSLTQTALLHVQGERVDREKLRKYLDIYQTSSPSYVLMAGMDACIRLLEERGGELFDAFVDRLERMRSALWQKLRVLRLVSGTTLTRPDQISRSTMNSENEGGLEGTAIYDLDRSKVLISTARCALTGPELADLLRNRYHLEPEMAAADYVTAIMTVADTQEGFDRLTAALFEIDKELAAKFAAADVGSEQNNIADGKDSDAGRSVDRAVYENRLGIADRKEIVDDIIKRENYRENCLSGEEVLSIRQAGEAAWEQVPLANSAGRISAEYVYLYPPGIPLLVPGERITEKLLLWLRREQDAGLALRGMADGSGRTIRVVREI